MIDPNLELTEKALAELKENFQNLKDVLDRKKNALSQQKDAYKNNMHEKNMKIDELKGAIKVAAQKLQTTAQKIDEVINENGTGNNSN